MHIAIIQNPKSGRGRAQGATAGLSEELLHRGHLVRIHNVDEPHHDIRESIGECDRVVVVGGDGTVHHLLDLLCELQIPLYHLATGTANLIAKYFGMSRSPRRVGDDLERAMKPRMIDIPSVNGTKFMIMLSIGIDASVIHRFEASRTLGGGYRAYSKPILQELFRPRPALICVHTPDGKVHEMSKSGIAVFANMPSYALGMNPCTNADPCDGMIDVRFVSAQNSLRAGLSFATMRLRIPRGVRVVEASSSMIVRARSCPARIQIDGECPTHVRGLIGGVLYPGSDLEIRVSEDQIPIHA